MRIDLSTEEGYDIAAAIRGPDFEAPILKFVVTGYIRYVTGASGGVVRRHRIEVSSVGHRVAREMENADRSSLLHYLYHCHDALRSLQSTTDKPTSPLLAFVKSIRRTPDPASVIRALNDLEKRERAAGIRSETEVIRLFPDRWVHDDPA